jgi:catechol 2,3-dioxygenase-like lactoylglutathione lyase family enzyme
MRLRRAIIFTKNIERMTAFYRDALGLIPLPDKSSEGWLELDAGGVALALHAIPGHIAKDIEIADPPTARERTPIKLVFEVPDIEVARIHLINHGAEMSEPSAWGSCDGADPDGNVFQIVRRQLLGAV